MISCLGTTKQVEAIARMAKASRLTVEQTPETVRVKDGEETVYAALRKGGSTWIVRYNPNIFATEA